MAALCGRSGTVVAFEPDPHARRLIDRNISLNPDLKPPIVQTLVVSDRSGPASLYTARGNANSSLVEAGLGTPATSECITVEQTTLDDFLLARGLPTPRLVKIDVEGAEIRVLKGARHLLAGSTEILCERHPYAWVAFGNSLDELKALARANGRRVRYLDREGEIGERAVYGIVALER